jgi:hypothetical protein
VNAPLFYFARLLYQHSEPTFFCFSKEFGRDVLRRAYDHIEVSPVTHLDVLHVLPKCATATFLRINGKEDSYQSRQALTFAIPQSPFQA